MTWIRMSATGAAQRTRKGASMFFRQYLELCARAARQKRAPHAPARRAPPRRSIFRAPPPPFDASTAAASAVHPQLPCERLQARLAAAIARGAAALAVVCSTSLPRGSAAVLGRERRRWHAVRTRGGDAPRAAPARGALVCRAWRGFAKVRLLLRCCLRCGRLTPRGARAAQR